MAMMALEEKYGFLHKDTVIIFFNYIIKQQFLSTFSSFVFRDT